MNDFEKLVEITGEILNIHPEPISHQNRTVELNMGELLMIASKFSESRDEEIRLLNSKIQNLEWALSLVTEELNNIRANSSPK